MAAFLTVTALFLANVPGRNVVLIKHAGGSGPNVFEHGWPFACLSREIWWSGGAGSGIGFGPHSSAPPLVLETSIWPSWSELVDLHIPYLLIDFASALLILAIMVLATEYRIRRRGLRISLAELMLLPLTVSAGFGWIAYQHREFLREESLQSLDDFHAEVQPGGPWWLRQVIGDDFLRFRDRIIWARSPNATFLPRISEIRHLKALSLDFSVSKFECAGKHSHVPTTSISQLRDCRGLIALQLTGEMVDNNCLDDVALLVRLKHLDLSFTSVTSQEIYRLKALQDLESLDLSFNTLGPFERDWFPMLPKLKLLHLEDTNATDDSLEAIAKLPSLKFISLSGTQLTDKGIVRLKNAIPNLETDRDP